MPKVAGKKYAYTPIGMKQAAAAKKHVALQKTANKKRKPKRTV